MPPIQDEQCLLLTEEWPEHDKGMTHSLSLKQVVGYVRADQVLKERGLLCASSASDSDNSEDDLSSRFRASSLRASKLMVALESRLDEFSISPTLAACKSSLQTRFPMMLHQTSQLVDGLEDYEGECDRIVTEIQSKFALECIEQYLDNIAKSMHLEERAVIDDKLTAIRESLFAEAPLPEGYNCCASAGITSSLVFDVEVGSVATAEIQGAIQAEVTPIVEMSARDLVEGKVSSADIRAHHVGIKSCKYSSLQFPSACERTGEARICLRLSRVSSEGKADWNGSNFGADPVTPLKVKEVRVSQVNSYPPRLLSTVDIYTSQPFGGSELTLTLVMKTFKTEHGEPPKLQVDLVLPVSY